MMCKKKKQHQLIIRNRLEIIEYASKKPVIQPKTSGLVLLTPVLEGVGSTI